jgi:hypothetical protein
LFVSGALLAVEISAPQPLIDLLTNEGKPIPVSKTGYGLIDTGAHLTTLHEDFVKDLGVNTVGAYDMSTPAGGVESHNTYPVHLKVPSHAIDVDLPEIITADLSHFLTPQGDIIIGLIGRDFLSTCILIYNGHLGMYTLAN